MRDQIKNAEYFEAFFEYIDKEIAYYKNIISNPQDNTESRVKWAYSRIFNHKLNKLIGKYSAGADLNELRNDYIKILNNYYNQSFSPEYFNGNIRMVSLAVLFNLEDSYMLKIKALYGEHQKNKWINEWLINFLLNPDVSPSEIKAKLILPNIYEPLKAVVFAGENQIALFDEYVSKLWYRKHRGSHWWNSHKTTEYPAYAGYWCFEAAAVAKRLSLDDSSLKDCKYYPYELAHFE